MSALGEQQITELVRAFYARARSHPELGPLFESSIPDWDTHMQIIRDFWSDRLLGTQRYRKQPYPAHATLPIQRQHFDQWLGLFQEAATETLPPEAAEQAMRIARHMTRSFRSGLFPFDPPAA